MAGIEQLVEHLERSYEEAQQRMSDPSVYNDRRQAAIAGRRLKELEGPYKLAQERRQAQADLADARSDPRSRAGVDGFGERGGAGAARAGASSGAGRA